MVRYPLRLNLFANANVCNASLHVKPFKKSIKINQVTTWLERSDYISSMTTRIVWLLVLFSLGLPSLAIANPPAATDPALIPLPQSIRWAPGKCTLSASTSIYVDHDSLQAEAAYLQVQLSAEGFATNIFQGKATKQPVIRLLIAEVKAPRNAAEAYQLTVRDHEIILKANTTHGLFNGIQTLLQLVQPNGAIPHCTIIDYPAFAWRGYMIDVGRNFQSVAQLKQQIAIMARYKLNIFHFHLTEDLAWRLEIKKYPQLTSPDITARNKGKFYSVTEMKDLISFCSVRHITLVPEIDVPGHSQAFRRAMGVDMQSPAGTAMVIDIFNELCSTYHFPFIHIGADEVKITNPDFISDVSATIRKHPTQIVAWAPGGKYDNGIIRQLWKDEGDKEVGKKGIRYIDAKFLYISDQDPHNSVVTIFNRQFGNKPAGDTGLLGAEFCVWNDRRVNDEQELVSRNPVYPSMLAFAERSWQGNGYPGIVFFIGPDNEPRARAFQAFESRLLIHKQRYFSQLPFLYVKQTHIQWKLIGPFDNDGVLSSIYWPEKATAPGLDTTKGLRATGGTIWLWQTHGPAVRAWLPAPKEKTTWYAYTKFWSDQDSTMKAWIDLKDLSRSGADATPPAGQWDQVKSAVWVNGQLFAPPSWQFPGRAAGKLEEPMVDENYYYRDPVILRVNKGWNTVLFKLPMGAFNPHPDWQVPPKWMFTFIPVQRGKGINWDATATKFNTGE
jgi:hexosaminidase